MKNLHSSLIHRGFTLIELLVVIAIIGILSAVVLASLNTARAKGTDASIKSDLNTVQTQATLDYDAFPNEYAASTLAVSATISHSFTIGTGSAGGAGVSVFGSGTGGDSTAQNALNQAASVAGGGLQYGYAPSTYVVQAALTSTSGTYWCIDSNGIAKAESAALLTTATKCL
jgi:prepilin-type N-terminal cleavage/methylation domain-containing protein